MIGMCYFTTKIIKREMFKMPFQAFSANGE